MSDAATVLAIYRFRPDVTDDQISDLLSRHRSALEQSGLVTAARPTVVRSAHTHPEHKDFIEIFEWTSAEAPAKAHTDPAVSQIWHEFSTLTTTPTVTLSQLAEAAHPWPTFAPFGVAYAAPAKTVAPAKAKTAGKAAKTKKAVKGTKAAKAAPKKPAKPMPRKAAKAKAPVKATKKAGRAMPAKATKKRALARR